MNQHLHRSTAGTSLGLPCLTLNSFSHGNHRRCRNGQAPACSSRRLMQSDIAVRRTQACVALREHQSGTGGVATVAQRPGAVELSLQISYKCAFGQHVAVVGSFQGWQTSAPLAMTWQAGNVWTAALPLPGGCDIEYKYIIVDQQGNVVRWQEGSNNQLSLRDTGFLLLVTDTWAHESRQVHEIGVPAQTDCHAPGHISSSGGSSSGSTWGISSSNRAAPAQSQVQLQNNITAFSPGTSSGFSRVQQCAAASVKPQQQQQQQQDPQSYFAAAAAAASQSVASSSNSADSSPADTSDDQLSRDVAELLPLLQIELASALNALAADQSNTAEHEQLVAEGQCVLGVLQQQLSQAVPPLPAELLLASFDDSNYDASDALEQLLQDQFAAVEAAADAAGVDITDLCAPAAAMSYKPLDSSITATSTGVAAASRPPTPAHASNMSSISGRRPSNKERSRAGSATSPLASASEDEIAAALLSDDCEEACFCLVDAICSCMGAEGSMEEVCEQHAAQERSTCAAETPVAAAEELVSSTVHVTAAGHPAVEMAVPVVQAATLVASDTAAQGAAVDDELAVSPSQTAVCAIADTLTAAATVAEGTAAASEAAFVSAVDDVVSVVDLVAQQAAVWSPAAAAVSSARRHSSMLPQGRYASAAHQQQMFSDAQGSEEARAVAFAGVHNALQKSAELLERLADPTHPLLLEADREVANAKRQMGHLLAA